MTKRLPWIGLVLAALALSVWWLAGRDRESTDSRTVEAPAAAASEAVEGPVTAPADGAAEQRNPTPVAAQSAPRAPLPELFVRGRIVDARRFPVSALDVHIDRQDGSTEIARTDAKGEFALPILRRPARAESLRLRAWRADDAAVATQYLYGADPDPKASLHSRMLRTADVDFGTIALTEAKPLAIEVVHGAEPASGAAIVVRGRMLLGKVWEGTTDADGRAVTHPLPRGFLDVLATHGASAGLARVFLPEEPTVRIELVPQFSVDVTVVDQATSRGIAGARVQLGQSVWQAAEFRGDPDQRVVGEMMASLPDLRPGLLTDESGFVRIEGLSAGERWSASASAANYAAPDPRESRPVPLSATSGQVRIELTPLVKRSVRFPISAGDLPMPAEGSKVALRAAPGVRGFPYEAPEPDLEGVVRGGEVHVADAGQRINCLGVAEDGSIASFFCNEKSDVGRAVTFAPPRKIEVVVHDGAGAPFPGVTVHVRNQGNNHLGEATTDAEGRAVIAGLHGNLADVYLLSLPPLPYEKNVGSVDLRQGDGLVEAVLALGERASLTIEITLDGKRTLPAKFRASAGPESRVVEEHPETGELVLELPAPAPGSDVKVSLAAEGCVPASTSLAVKEGGAPLRCSIALTRGTTLVGRVLRDPNQSVTLSVAKWDEAKAEWVRPPGMLSNGIGRPNGPGGSSCFGPLGPGRYRLTETQSKTDSAAVEVVPGAQAVELELDVRGVEEVTGRVEAADAAEYARARVIQSRGPSAPAAAWLPGREPPEGAYVKPDGTFQLRVRRGMNTRIEPWHPWLAPAEVDGYADVDGARQGVVLRLVEGDQLKLAAPQFAAKRGNAIARVAVFDGAASGKPRAWLHAPLVDGTLRFRGVPRGTVTLWIDPGDTFAPLVLRDVAIGEGVVDLGTAEFPRGSALSLQLVVPEGQAAPRVYLRAVRTTEPALERSLNSQGEDHVLLTGLEAGEYRVTCHGIMGRDDRRERILVVDGVNDVEVE